MSFFKTAEKKFDSFFSAIGHYMKEVFGDSSVEAKVNGTLTLLTPAVVELVNLIGGPGASAIVTAGISQFKADYATLCAVTQGSFPAPGGNAAGVVKGLLGSLQQNLTAILADSGVKNSANKDKISGYATFFLNEAEAIVEEIEAAEVPATKAAQASPASVAQMPTPASSAPSASGQAAAAELQKEGIDATATATGIDVKVPADDAPAAAPAPGHTGVAAVKPLI